MIHGTYMEKKKERIKESNRRVSFKHNTKIWREIEEKQDK